jgi:WD40 repeat protein
LKLWRVSDGALLRTITNAHSDTIFALDFSPDGQWLASAGADRFARVWNVTNGALVKAFEGHTHHVVGVSWRRDGRVLATAGADRVVKIWDFNSGTQKKSTEAAAKEMTGVQFLGIGGELLASRGDAIVRRFREDGATVKDLPGATNYMTCVAATPDARWLLAAGHDSIVRVWNTKGEPWAEFRPDRDQAALLTGTAAH